MSKQLAHLFLPMTCEALRKNLYDCHRMSEDGFQYCHKHINTDSEILKDRWMRRFILGQGDAPSFLFMNVSVSNQQRIVHDLETGLITLTQEDLARIPTKFSHVDIVIFLIMHGFMKPENHLAHMISCYRYYCTVANLRGIIPRNHEGGPMHLDALIEKYLILASDRTLYLFLYCSSLILKKAQEHEAFLLRYIPSLLDSDAAKELSWWSREKLDAIHKLCVKTLGKESTLSRCFLERWLLDLKELYRTEKDIQRIKMDTCKEELMMNRWHPSRLEKYLEMGLDMEDM